MLNSINFKKLSLNGILAVIVASSLIVPSNLVDANNGNGNGNTSCKSNNGHGNNAPVDVTLNDGTRITGTYDPSTSNPGAASANNRLTVTKSNGQTISYNSLSDAQKTEFHNKVLDIELRGRGSGNSECTDNSSTSSVAPTIPAPTTPVPTRALINPSFESPSFTGTNWYSLDNYIPGDDTTLQGWFSTHPTTGFSGDGESRFKDPRTGQNFTHLVEIWANSYDKVPAASGKQFAELNAQASSALYQDILVFAGEQIPWSASHRGRGKPNVADVAEVFISDPNDWTGATFPGSGTRLYSARISTANDGAPRGISGSLGSTNQKTTTPLSNGWVRYSDTWVGPSVTKEYRFAFQSVSTGSGNNTIGNFLDDIQIKLSPVVDLVNPNISNVNPVGDSVYYLPVRINGMLESSATVEIDVSLDGSDFTNYTLNALVSGTNETVYNGVTATKLANGNIQVSIPLGIYDPNNPAHYISVPINFNQALSETSKTATFNIVNANGGGGSGTQNMLIPPADSGFVKTQTTTVLGVNANKLPSAEDDTVTDTISDGKGGTDTEYEYAD